MADGTYTIHEEVVRVGFDDAAALAQLARLQALADAVFSKLQGPGGGGGGGAAPSGSGGTTPSGNLPSPPPPGGTSPSGPSGGGGAGGGGGSGGGTTPSGGMPNPGSPPSPGKSIWTDEQLEDEKRKAREAEREEPTKPSGWGNIDRLVNPAIRGTAQAIASGRMADIASAATSVLGSTIGTAVGGPGGAIAGTAISALGTISGLGTLDENTRARSLLERNFGQAQLAGFGNDSIQSRTVEGQKMFGVQLTPTITSRVAVSGMDEFLRHASDIGMEPDSAVAAANAYTRSAGGRVDSNGRIIDASLAGIDASTVGSIDQSRLLGGAAGNADSAMRLAGVGQQGFGIFGGLNDFLQKLSGQFDRLIDHGMKVDLEGSAAFLGKMAEAGYTGRQGLGAMAASSNAAVGAKDQLLAPFKGLMQKSVLLDAVRSGGGLEDWIRYAENASANPQGGIDSVRNNFGELGGFAFAADIDSLGIDGGQRLNRNGLGAGRDYGMPQGQSRESLRRQALVAGRNERNVTQENRRYTYERQRQVSDTSEGLAGFTTDIGNGIWTTAEYMKQLLDWVRGGGDLSKMPLIGAEKEP